MSFIDWFLEGEVMKQIDLTSKGQKVRFILTSSSGKCKLIRKDVGFLFGIPLSWETTVYWRKSVIQELREDQYLIDMNPSLKDWLDEVDELW